MTQEKIDEGNHLIAEFLGYKKKSFIHADYAKFYYKGKQRFYQLGSMKYHESFDWIIKAIIKFRSFELDNHEYNSWVEAIDNSVIDAYDIEQVFYELVMAINWYNEKIIK